MSFCDGAHIGPIVGSFVMCTGNGGFCTFCGAPLDLRSQSSSSAQSSTSNARLHSDPASAAEREAEEIHTRAIELKNTLVDFDRNAEKRTTVIDDQSDFFEIDNNVWLSEQVIGIYVITYTATTVLGGLSNEE